MLVWSPVLVPEELPLCVPLKLEADIVPEKVPAPVTSRAVVGAMFNIPTKPFDFLIYKAAPVEPTCILWLKYKLQLFN